MTSNSFPPPLPSLSSADFSFQQYFDTLPEFYTYLPPYVVKTVRNLPVLDQHAAVDSSAPHQQDSSSPQNSIILQNTRSIFSFLKDDNNNQDATRASSSILPRFRIPIASDSQFLSLCELIFILEALVQQTYKSLAESLIRKMISREESKFILDAMMHLKDSISVYVESRLRYSISASQESLSSQESHQSHAHPFTPRLIRLCRDKLNLRDPKLVESFLFIVISHSGSQFPSIESGSTASASSVASFCDLSHDQLLSFLSEQQPFIKNGLLELDTTYQDTICGTIIKIPKEVCLALSGCKLDADDYLKISGTPLVEVLDEEEEDEEEMDEENATPSSTTAPEDDDATPVRSPKENEPENNDQSPLSPTDDLLDQLEDAQGDAEQLYQILKQHETETTATDVSVTSKKSSAHTITPYTSNIEYLDEYFKLIATRIKQRNVESEQKQEEGASFKVAKDRSSDALARELSAKARLLYKKCTARLELTSQNTDFEPRLEKLARLRNLTQMDKLILLCIIGANISHDIKFALTSSYSMAGGKSDWTVALLLYILCDSLQERVEKRCHFYKKSVLISDGMIRLSNRFGGDLMDCVVSVDRRILDYVVGLDGEFNEIVEGSHLFFPNVSLDQVVLPEEQKKLIIQTVENYDRYKFYRKKLGFEEIISYGNSLVMLFYGLSGTGKSMLAKALATHLQKKMLLINFANMDSTGELLKFIFRESKLNNALIFFDECEAFFESRNKASSQVQALLTEIESFDGLIIMATNKPADLDSAMRRRISLALEFHMPDAILREKIWRNHVPSGVKMAENIDFEKLAVQYELSGGLIKNSVLQALSFAVARLGEQKKQVEQNQDDESSKPEQSSSSEEEPVISQEDLEKAARIQLTNGIMQLQFDRRVVPSHGLESVIVEDHVMKQLRSVVRFEKARKILHSSWGFSKGRQNTASNNVFMHGKSGCGQSYAAEAIAFEVGCPIKVVDISEIIARYAYSTTKNIHTLFEEVQQMGTVLVIEISAAVNLEDSSFHLLLQAIEHYSALVIVVSNVENIFDRSVLRRFKFVIPFKEPNRRNRLKLWKQLLPSEMPLSDDVNLEELASRFQFNGRQIDNVIFKAASAAVMRSVDDAVVTMKTLLEACEEELKHVGDIGRSSMYQ